MHWTHSCFILFGVLFAFYRIQWREVVTLFTRACNNFSGTLQHWSFSTLCVAITQKIRVDLAQNKELLTFQRCKQTKVNGTLFTNFKWRWEFQWCYLFWGIFCRDTFFPVICCCFFVKNIQQDTFMQDFNPKHTSQTTLTLVEMNEINWWRRHLPNYWYVKVYGSFASFKVSRVYCHVLNNVS